MKSSLLLTILFTITSATAFAAAPEPLPAEGLQPAKAPLDLSATTLAGVRQRILRMLFP